MNFTKVICPACKKLTTQVFDTDNYICMDEKHYYRVYDDRFELVFEKYSIADYLSTKDVLIRDQHGNRKSFSGHMIECKNILNLSNTKDVIEFFQNYDQNYKIMK